MVVQSLLLWLVILATAALTTIGWSARTLLRPTPSLPRAAAQALHNAGRRTMTALLATAGTIVAFAVWIGVGSGSAALPIALAPAVSATVGVGAYSLLPRRSAAAPEPAIPVTRMASLESRTWWNQSPRLPRALLLSTLVATLGLLIAGALTSSVDAHGNPVLHREFDGGALVVSSGPYPGWIYAGPLIAAVTVLAIVTVMAMRRLSTIAVLPGPELAQADGVWRRGSANVMCLVSLAGLGLTLAGVAFIMGSAVYRAHQQASPIWSAIGVGMMIGGALTALGATAALTLAVLRSLELTRIALRSSREIGTAVSAGSPVLTGAAGPTGTVRATGTAEATGTAGVIGTGTEPRP